MALHPRKRLSFSPNFEKVLDLFLILTKIRLRAVSLFLQISGEGSAREREHQAVRSLDKNVLPQIFLLCLTLQNNPILSLIPNFTLRGNSRFGFDITSVSSV